MKRIAALALIGWSGIVWLAWHLADARIAACRYSTGYTCELRATAARDTILTNGLTVALVSILVVCVWGAASRGRSDRVGEYTISPPWKSLPSRMKAVIQRRAGQQVKWLAAVCLVATGFALGWISAAGAGRDHVTRAWGSAPIVEYSPPPAQLTPVEGDPFAAQGAGAVDEADETDQQN
ncbi:MAG: hypothetical protein ACKOPG_10390 [Novosphingobium sp.]